MQMSKSPILSVRRLSVFGAFFLLWLSTATLSAQSNLERYYYFQGERIPLPVNTHLIAARFDAGVSVAAQKRLAANIGALENFDSRVELPVDNLVFLPVRAGGDSIIAAEQLGAQPGVQFVSPVYNVGIMQVAETGEFFARFKPNLAAAEIEAFNQQQGATQTGALPNADNVWSLKPKADNPLSARELANAYVEAGMVEFAEPNFVLRETAPRPLTPPMRAPELTSNDTAFQAHLQWGLQNTGIFQSAIPGADINAVSAWNVTQGANNIVIAVIDEGVDATHPDLAGKVLSGWNTLDNNNNTAPVNNDYHGTAVAGVAAANSNNAMGAAGVCWNCKILPVKVAQRDPQGNWVTRTDALASGINWAWQHGADVLNNSWTAIYSNVVLDAIVAARFSGRGDYGSAIVFAAGNTNAAQVPFPANQNTYVIAVGASNWCDQRKLPLGNACNNNNASWGSNYGSALDLVAPGEAIYTTCYGSQYCQTAQDGNKYQYFSGTSFAAPFVSGVIGLLYSLNPNLKPDEIQQLLQRGAKDLGVTGRDNETGYGRLDAYKSIAQLFNLRLSVTDNRTLARVGEKLTYTLAYANTGSAAISNVVLQVTLPAHTAYVSSTPAFTPQGGGVYTLNLGALASYATGSVTLRAQTQPSSAGQKMTLSATIASSFPEANTADNAAADTTLGIQSQNYLPLIVR